MLSFIINLLISGLALMIASYFLDGVSVKGYWTAIKVAFLIAILNATVGEFLSFGIFQSGLLHFIVDAVVLLLASSLMSDFKIKGLLTAIVLAVVLALLSTFLTNLLISIPS